MLIGNRIANGICLLLLLISSLSADAATQVILKAHESARLHLGQVAVLQIPSANTYRREYYEGASERGREKLPVLSRRRYELTLDGNALTPLEAKGCRHLKSVESEEQKWLCELGAVLHFRAHQVDRAVFLLVPTGDPPRSGHCIDCVLSHYFIEVVP